MNEIKVVDKDHIWYEGKQYISLRRFNELKFTEHQEIEILAYKVEELTTENNSLKNLLKAQW